MKVTVKRKVNIQEVPITTEFIKLQDAMKLANLVESGGEAKVVIQEGNVSVNGEVCTQRGRKLRPGDSFRFEGNTFRITQA